MSAVRMCDMCGKIFSERSDGWTTMQAQRVTRKDGRQQVQGENLDTCVGCSTGTVVEPRVALTASAAVERIADTLTDEERERILNGER